MSVLMLMSLSNLRTRASDRCGVLAAFSTSRPTREFGRCGFTNREGGGGVIMIRPRCCRCSWYVSPFVDTNLLFFWLMPLLPPIASSSPSPLRPFIDQTEHPNEQHQT